MNSTLSVRALLCALGCTTACVIATTAQAEGVRSSVPMVNPDPKPFERLSDPPADAAFEGPAPQVRGESRGAEFCPGAGFDCTTTLDGGYDQFNFVSNGDFVGFSRCDTFDPIENLVTDPDVPNPNLNSLCWRGLTVNGAIGGTPDCSPALDIDALVGFRIQVWDTDGLGLPQNAIGLFDTGGAHTNFGGATFNNMIMARFNCGETFANGARPLTTWHVDLGANPQQGGSGVALVAGDCYWWGVCWDGTVGGSDFNCTFRWLAYDLTGISSNSVVMLDNSPPDGIYTACNVSPSTDLDFSTNLDCNDPADGLDGWAGTTNPPGRIAHSGTVATPCLDASLFLPPANDVCSGAVALTCDTESFHCPIFAVQGPDTINDLMFSCFPDGVHPSGVPSWLTWYTFTATGTEVLIDTDPEFNNSWGSIIALFDYTGGNPGNPCSDLAGFTEVACNDDFEAGDGLICTSGLTPGRTYYLLAGSDDDLNVGELYINLICDTNMIPNPANDDCTTAMPIAFAGNIGEALNQDTRCAGLDPLASACGGTSNGITPGLWYSAVGDGTNWEISLCNVSACGVSFDTQVNVYCGNCDCGLVCITGDDDGCGTSGGPSITTVCTRPGVTYYIFVHGFFEVGCFDMIVTKNFDGLGNCDFNSTPDCNIPAGGLCDVDVSTGITYTELEPCGDDTNDGCTGAPTAMGPGAVEFVDCGDVIAGQCFGENNFRDLDYYSFTLAQRSLVTYTLETEFIGTIFVFDSNDCSTNVVLTSPTVNPCDPVEVSLVLEPGGYEIAVSLDNFNGFPCGCDNNYRLEIACDALGACCDPSDNCFVTAQTTCEDDLMGDFDGGACPTITYTRNETCSETFSSIAGVGTAQLVEFAGQIDAEFFAMPFNFNFFGELKNAVGVTTKGYVSFADIVTITGTPAAIPSGANPNDLAAPFWANLDAINGSAETWVLVDTPGSQVIVEYNSLGRFSPLGPSGSNTFQVKINGNTGCVRFVYGSITPAPTAANTSAGIENSSGTVGNTVSNVANLGSSRTIRCVDFCPQATGTDPCPIVPTGCDGDADGNMAVNVNDISYVVFRLGNMPGVCGDGDVDGNGSVNVNDISYVVFRLGTCNPGGPCN